MAWRPYQAESAVHRQSIRRYDWRADQKEQGVLLRQLRWDPSGSGQCRGGPSPNTGNEDGRLIRITDASLRSSDRKCERKRKNGFRRQHYPEVAYRFGHSSSAGHRQLAQSEPEGFRSFWFG